MKKLKESAAEKRIEIALPKPIDSANGVELASGLVRICSRKNLFYGRGLLPTHFGGNDKTTHPIRMAKRHSTGRQSNWRNPLEGEALQFRHPQFLKNMRGSSIEKEWLIRSR